jgi:hypothetical protein
VYVADCREKMGAPVQGRVARARSYAYSALPGWMCQLIELTLGLCVPAVYSTGPIGRLVWQDVLNLYLSLNRLPGQAGGKPYQGQWR